jgi:hypothetical protein
MTEGHKHREVRATRGSLPVRLLTRPLWWTTNTARADASPYPYGVVTTAGGFARPDGPTERYYLSALSILHRWTGLTLRFPDDPPEA